MAIITGYGGYVHFVTGGVQDLLIHHWTFSADQELFDVSSFDSETQARTWVAGLHKATGTIEGFVDSALVPKLDDFETADSTGNPIELVLTGGADGLVGYEFTAILSNFSMSVGKREGPQTWSCNYESTGALSVTVSHA